MANTFASDASDFDSTAVIVGQEPSSIGITGFFKMAAARFAMKRQERIDAEVGRFIEAHGGQITDDLERQISRRFGSHAGQW